jgi:hypothetical protein
MHKFCSKQVDDIIDRMHLLCGEGRSEDASALYEEIQGWIVEGTDIEIMSLDYIGEID